MKIDDSNIKKTIKYLNNDECVAIPTETVYGLAANAYSKKAVSKIFKLKKRPKKNKTEIRKSINLSIFFHQS